MVDAVGAVLKVHAVSLVVFEYEEGRVSQVEVDREQWFAGV